MSFSEQIFAVTAVFLLRQIHKGLSKSSLNYPLGSRQLPNSYLPDKSLDQGCNSSLWCVSVLENPCSRAMRSVLGILKGREEPELCSQLPQIQSYSRRSRAIPGGVSQQEVSGESWCVRVFGLWSPGEGRAAVPPGRALLAAPAQPLIHGGSSSSCWGSSQGAGLVLWPCFPCSNSTWELNSPWHSAHPWLQCLSPSWDTAPGTALPFHIPISAPRTRHDFPSTVPDICILSPF